MNLDPVIHGRDDQAGSYDERDDDPSGLNLDLRGLWAVIYRGRLILLAAVALGLLLAVLYLILATPKYEAKASVQIEQESTRILKGDSADAARDTLDAERFLTTQIDIIKSRSIALAVARNLHLIGNQDFLRRMHLAPQSAAPAPATAKPMSRHDQESQVAGVLQAFMHVEIPVDSRLATISFRSPDPALAAQVANGYADSYIQADIERKYGASAYARQFISQQLQDAKLQLERSERAALAYGSQQRLIDTSNGPESGAAGQGPKSLTVARLVSTNTAYADSVARRTQAEEKWRQAQGAAIMSLPEVLANPTIQQLLQQRAAAQADYQNQRQIRKEDFPSIRQAKAQIDELSRQIDRLSDNVRSSLRSQYEAALRQENALREQIGGLEQATLNEQQREVQLSILRRATDTSRSLYDTLLQRYRELNAEAGVQPNNLQIIDRAEVPGGPVSPKLFLSLLLGLVAGLILGTGAIFILENINETVRSGEDVDRKLGIPLLGSVPKVRANEVSVDLQDLKSTVSEAYSSIRASLLMSSRTGLPRTLAFTSVQPGEGKTTTSFATAIGLARIGRRVMVIDCDLRRPAVHKAFGVANGSGMSNVLSGQATLDTVKQETRFPNVTVVTSGPIPPNPTELLSGEALGAILQQLRGDADVVIVDAPPILGLADAVIVGAQVEGTVMVLESGRNYHGGLKSAIARLRKSGTRTVGAIITKQNMRDLGYNYSDKYQYAYGE